MRKLHDRRLVDLNVIRGFLVIAEVGSMGKAARQLHVSQSTLTRQIQSLESEVGGALFERSERGVVLTAAGRVFSEGVQPHVDAIARVVQKARQTARGQHDALRVGYIASVAQRYLSPALRALRNSSPPVKVTLLDMTPSEQLAALQKGDLDVALVGFATESIEREFYARKLATVPAVAVLPDTHRLAKKTHASLAELREETFITIPDVDAPGYNDWVRAICRKAGFRPRFTESADSMSHLVAMISAENVAAIVPQYALESPPSGVHVLRLTERYAVADLIVAWPRGKLRDPVRRMLATLFPKPSDR
jgi:DNA-binding transcriptional LysR family regulator